MATTTEKQERKSHEASLGFSPGLGARQLPTVQGKRVATAFHITSPVLK
jgi:hypothetical protein